MTGASWYIVILIKHIKVTGVAHSHAAVACVKDGVLDRVGMALSW